MIVPLHAANPGPLTGAGNWTYFLPGRHPTLVDAGTGVPAHLEAVAAAGADDTLHVLVTHAHPDHIGGVDALAARWPGARFSKFPWPERDGRHAVAWHALGDDDVIPAGDGALRVVHTPGHSPDHVAFWHEPTRTLFSGDLVTPGTTVVIPATQGGRLADYLASLDRVLELAPARLLPAHGEPVADPAAIVGEYLEHRRQRERQIVSALAAGARTVPELVARIYDRLAPPLVPMARESVLAHLVKLADEGRARATGDAWELLR